MTRRHTHYDLSHIEDANNPEAKKILDVLRFYVPEDEKTPVRKFIEGVLISVMIVLIALALVYGLAALIPFVFGGA